MDLEQRNAFIAARLNEGKSLSDVQKLLTAEGVNMTYLDLRLLAADLQVNWQKQDPAVVAKKEKPVDPDAAAKGAKTSGTTVSVNKLVRPGAAMSGDVSFASGAKAEWYLDTYGRVGLNPAPGSGKPTEEDIREFQAELQRKISGGGV